MTKKLFAPKAQLLCIGAVLIGVLVIPQLASAVAVRGLTGYVPTVFGPNDDGTYPATGLGAGVPPGTPAPVAVGFTMNFYGVNFNSVYVNNNGNVTLDAPLSTFTPFGLAGTATKIIAPFFADVDTRAGNVVNFGTGTLNGHNAFAVNWPGVGYYSEHVDRLNNFQLILVDRSDIGAGDFDIEFNYDQMQWETGDASGGSGGLGGTPGAVGYSNGGAETLQLPGSMTPGALIDGGPDALISHSLNSGVDGRYDFFVRNGVVQGVPEPASILTPLMALLGLVGFGRFSRRG